MILLGSFIPFWTRTEAAISHALYQIGEEGGLPYVPLAWEMTRKVDQASFGSRFDDAGLILSDQYRLISNNLDFIKLLDLNVSNIRKLSKLYAERGALSAKLARFGIFRAIQAGV